MVSPLPGDRLSALLPSGWSPRSLDLSYSTTPGAASLRDAIARLDGLSADHLILTHGATEANAAAILALGEPGCNLVVQDPLYYQVAALASGLGFEVRRWTLPADPRAPVDLDQLSALLDSRTRLVVLNTPHNPTGRVLSSDTLQAIARRVEALRDCHLLVDEIYRGVTPPVGESIVNLTERGIAVNSVSKRWSLPGLRLGWAACASPDLARRLLAWHEHMTCSVSRLGEQLLEGLWPRREELWAENAAIAARNRLVFERWRQGLSGAFDVAMPPAGVMTLVGLGGNPDDRRVARDLRERHDCFVVPGSCVGYPGMLRVGFGHRDVEALEAALERLALALALTREALV